MCIMTFLFTSVELTNFPAGRIGREQDLQPALFSDLSAWPKLVYTRRVCYRSVLAANDSGA